MVDEPTYEAELDHKADVSATDLKEAINAFGQREADTAQTRYGYEPGDYRQTTIEISSWSGGALLYLEVTDSHDETQYPIIGNSLVRVVLHAGYVPWGFRPERKGTDQEHTGRWMWYLRPVGDVTDDEFVTVEYGIMESETGEYLRDDDGHAITFEEAERANAVMELDEGSEYQIRKIVQ